jgi:hypothetical protein
MSKISDELKSKIETKIRNILEIDGLRFEYDVCDTLQVNVLVPFDDYRKVTDEWYKKDTWKEEQRLSALSGGEFEIRIRLKAIVPPMLPAKLGDFVLVFNDWDRSEEELPVGIVTSIIRNGGLTCYGCRHIVTKDKLTGNLSDVGNPLVGLTNENYGGYPVGFCKIIPEEEAIARVTKMVGLEMEKRILECRENLDSLGEDLLDDIKQYEHLVVTHSLSNKQVVPQDYERL